MSSFVPKKHHLRVVLLHHFLSKKSAAATHRILGIVYGDHALAEQTCRWWFSRFKSGNFDISGRGHPGQEKKFNDVELMELLDEDPYQTQEEIANSLNVDRSTISRRLKMTGMIQRQ